MRLVPFSRYEIEAAEQAVRDSMSNFEDTLHSKLEAGWTKRVEATSLLSKALPTPLALRSRLNGATESLLTSANRSSAKPTTGDVKLHTKWSKFCREFELG